MSSVPLPLGCDVHPSLIGVLEALVEGTRVVLSMVWAKQRVKNKLARNKHRTKRNAISLSVLSKTRGDPLPTKPARGKLNT